jgi:hypothetical protein
MQECVVCLWKKLLSPSQLWWQTEYNGNLLKILLNIKTNIKTVVTLLNRSQQYNVKVWFTLAPVDI